MQFIRELLEGKQRTKKFIKFGVTGGICVVVDFLIVFLCFEQLGINEYGANVVSTSVAVVISYWLNRTWTFRSQQPWKKEFVRFISISSFGLVLNNLIVYFGTPFVVKIWDDLCGGDVIWMICEHTHKLGFYFTKMSAIVIVFFWNFYINYKFNFKDRKKGV